MRLRARVGVHLVKFVSRLFRPCLLPSFSTHLPLAASQGNVDETAGVFEALESTALGDLGLLLGLNLCEEILSVIGRFGGAILSSVVPWGSET